MNETDTTASAPLLLYDGECGFCNRMVRFVLDHEAAPIVRFAPLQGPTAEKLLAQSGLPAGIGEKSIVVYDAGQFFIRSRASLKIMRHLGGRWVTFAKLLEVIPLILTDSVYRITACMRRLLPGNAHCRLLTPDERKRFLP